MSHIDYDATTTLDALIDISDAAARATFIRLREQLAGVPGLDERLVFDGQRKKPVLAFFRGDDQVLHVFPEPNVRVGLHVAVPIRAHEHDLLLEMLPDARIAPWLQDAVTQARSRGGLAWVDAVLTSPGRADDLVELVRRKLALLPTVH